MIFEHQAESLSSNACLGFNSIELWNIFFLFSVHIRILSIRPRRNSKKLELCNWPFATPYWRCLFFHLIFKIKFANKCFLIDVWHMLSLIIWQMATKPNIRPTVLKLQFSTKFIFNMSNWQLSTYYENSSVKGDQ